MVTENVEANRSHARGEITRRYRQLVVWEAAAVLRHDVRNKLASVRNAAFYLRRRVEAEATELCARDERVPKFFALIGSELDGAEAIIATRLPTLGEPGAAAPVALSEILDDALVALELPDGISLIPPAHDGDLRVATDRGELAVGLYCLLENAADALTPTGGTITVVVDRDADRATIEIADDGPGLPAEPRRVLEPFFTTRSGRLGLGLPIARRIAQRARGSLEIGNREGRGARARLALPIGGGADAAVHDPAGR